MKKFEQLQHKILTGLLVIVLALPLIKLVEAIIAQAGQ